MVSREFIRAKLSEQHKCGELLQAQTHLSRRLPESGV